MRAVGWVVVAATILLRFSCAFLTISTPLGKRWLTRAHQGRGYAPKSLAGGRTRWRDTRTSLGEKNTNEDYSWDEDDSDAEDENEDGEDQEDDQDAEDAPDDDKLRNMLKNMTGEGKGKKNETTSEAKNSKRKTKDDDEDVDYDLDDYDFEDSFYQSEYGGGGSAVLDRGGKGESDEGDEVEPAYGKSESRTRPKKVIDGYEVLYDDDEDDEGDESEPEKPKDATPPPEEEKAVPGRKRRDQEAKRRGVGSGSEKSREKVPQRDDYEDEDDAEVDDKDQPEVAAKNAVNALKEKYGGVDVIFDSEDDGTDEESGGEVDKAKQSYFSSYVDDSDSEAAEEKETEWDTNPMDMKTPDWQQAGLDLTADVSDDEGEDEDLPTGREVHRFTVTSLEQIIQSTAAEDTDTHTDGEDDQLL